MTAPTPALWLCADLAHPRANDPDALVARAVAVAARVPFALWLRGTPDTSVRALAALTRSAVERLRGTASVVFVGDRADVALAAGAHGVHLPERAIDPADVRALARSLGREDLLLSCAAHDAAGLARAALHADVALLSPFRFVAGKGPALEVSGFAALRIAAPSLAVMALGGVQSVEDARDARRAGAEGVVVRRAWLDVDDPVAVCAALAAVFAAPR